MQNPSDVPVDANTPNLPFEYPKEGIVSYARTHEDVLLWRILHNVHRGFYVDIGAHDPTAFSVTRAFYDHGWHGVNVEPDPIYAEKLRKERPRDLTLEVALGQSSGMATLYEFGDTGLSTLVKEIADNHKAAGFKATERQIPVTTLTALLNDLDDQQVHFLKIDVEGYELPVLRGADLAKVRPWIVLIKAVMPMTTEPSHVSWEHLLLGAGYEFAYFDGLNRYYVAEEHRCLKRYFSVPVSICDPFRDYEVVRLSAAVADLEPLSLKHEVPRLAGISQSPIVSDPSDPVGLLRIVETQASDLVRLRRALVSAQTLAAQRLRLVLTEGQILGWVRSTALKDIERVRNAIGDAVERSRWRRIGQRFGLAKRLAWEADDWRSDLSKAPAGDGRAKESVAELLLELERLNRLLDQMRLSRWRKLGHRFGLAKRLPWETGEWRDPLLIEPFPTKEVGSHPEADAGAKTLRSGYNDNYVNERFLEECRSFATDVIFDVGANTGQFAQCLRASGYCGHIISFEPLSDAHASLVEAADSDSLWDVAERCAVGASDGWSEINIAGNSLSSSLLPMLDLHREAARQSAYQGTEPCRLVSLDEYIERTFYDPTTLFGLKIDTQGHEAEVLAGLRRNHDRVKVIVCEMSLAPLYSDSPDVSELCRLLAELGYRCVALAPEFEDPRTGELLQVNGVFVKRG